MGAIALIKRGGTLFPILAHLSANLPSILNAAENDDISLISLMVI
jgi:hypothetical protein